MRPKLSLALLLLTALAMPTVADEAADLILDLKYGQPYIRADAAMSLGTLGDRRAVDPLVKALKDEDQNVRRYAAMSLGTLGDKRAVYPLVKALKDEDQSVRIFAAMSLGNLGDKRAVDPLIKVLDEDENYIVRDYAAYSLGIIGDPKAFEPLVEALNNKGGPITRTVNWFFSKITGSDNHIPLDLAATSVRSAAARGLGVIDDPRAVTPLIATINDEDEFYLVRVNAINSLGIIKNPSAIGPLTYLASNDKNAEVRDAASTALAVIESARG